MTERLAIPPLQRRKLYQQIVERFEQLIRAGKLRPGNQLPSERELMATFGTGRTAVREALFALNRMGLISIQNGERAVVTAPTPEVLIGELSGSAQLLMATEDGVRHFQNARRLFEVALVRHAARHRTEEDFVRLEAALDANRRSLGDPDEFVDTDVAFHFALVTIARNPIFSALHAALVAWLREQRSTSASERASSRAAIRAHTRIAEAIKAGSPDEAEAAMQQHLDEVEDYYWKVRGRR